LIFVFFQIYLFYIMHTYIPFVYYDFMITLIGLFICRCTVKSYFTCPMYCLFSGLTISPIYITIYLWCVIKCSNSSIGTISSKEFRSKILCNFIIESRSREFNLGHYCIWQVRRFRCIVIFRAKSVWQREHKDTYIHCFIIVRHGSALLFLLTYS